MTLILEPDTGYEFFQVDRNTEMQIVNFFFEQRNRVVSLLKKLRGKASKARELVVVKSEYDTLCMFELYLGLKHETQASNLGLRLRRNHSMVLQRIFATNDARAKKLKRELIKLIQRETKARFFRSPPKQLTEFFEKLISENS